MLSLERRLGALLPLASCLALLGSTLGAQVAEGRGADVTQALVPRHAHDRVIVGLEPGTRPAALQGAVKGLSAGAAPLSPIASEGFVVELAPGHSVADAMRELGQRPGVAYVEPDYWVRPAAVPDDPAYLAGDLWGMYGEDSSPHRNPFGSAAAAAWRAGYVGQAEVHVGIVDEGVKLDHPDLAANVWVNPFEVANGLDDDGNGYVDDIHGWDFYADDASVYDGGGDDHGTHVAGTIGARGGNGRGVVGVNWRVTLVPVKFLGGAGGYVSDAVRALDYLTDLRTRHNLHLVATNNSWTGGAHSQALADAIGRGGDAGILFVAAAGNQGQDVGVEPVYPGAYRCTERVDGSPRGWDCVISVANLDAAGARADDTNWGATAVDLGAPGSGILSTHPQDDGYARYSGTSMAAPHVTGAVALCASVDTLRSARRLREAILDTTVPTAALAGRTATGGRLDVARLIEHCLPEPVPTPVPEPTPRPTPEPIPSPTPVPTPTPTPTPTPITSPPARTVFVDELDAAFKRGGGGWTSVAAGYAGHHLRLPVRGDTRVSYGAWRPVLPAAGTYRVVAWIPIAPDASHAAIYKIRTADGWAISVRNQHKRQGGWVGLGIHELTTTPSVRLADLTRDRASLDRYLVYDVIRFIRLAESTEEGGVETTEPRGQTTGFAVSRESGVGSRPIGQVVAGSASSTSMLVSRKEKGSSSLAVKCRIEPSATEPSLSSGQWSSTESVSMPDSSPISR